MGKIALMGIALAIVVVALPATLAGPEIPSDKTAVESWFSQTITPFESRKAGLDVNLATAEASPVVVKVRKDGSGQFKTVQEAVNSVKLENKVRTIIDIGPGEYTEKIKVERFKSYITFLGDSKDRPTLSWNGNAAKDGTVESGTLIVEADYFVASNLIIKNSSPQPKLDTVGGQAVALRAAGAKGTFYNCRLIGFQDTLEDDLENHFYKDCYIEGTVDFIFGSGQAIYLNCEVHVISTGVITASARNNDQEKGGFVFVHGSVTGTQAGKAQLGRSWRPSPKVLFFCVDLGESVDEKGWSDDGKPATQKTVYFGEWKNTGPMSDLSKRVDYMKKLTDAEVKPYMTLDYIEGMKWILPPPEAKGAAAGALGAAAGAPGAAAGVPSAAAGAPGAAAVVPGAAAGAPGAATGTPGAAAVVPGAAKGTPAASK